MPPDSYLRSILQREAVDVRTASPLRALQVEIERICSEWAGRYGFEVSTAGAFEQGTSYASGMQVDFAVVVDSSTPYTVEFIYESLFEAFVDARLDPVRRDVTIAMMLRGVAVDVIPAKRDSMVSDDQWIWRRRARRATKTELGTHVSVIATSGRREEIRIAKLWRDQQGLDFPSFYLELSVLSALRERPDGALADNVWAWLGYLETAFLTRSLLDPANAYNIVSDDLDAAGRISVQAAASAARLCRSWQEIVH